MDALFETDFFDLTRMSLVLLSLVATSTTWIAFRLMSYATSASHLISFSTYFITYGVVRTFQCFTWTLNGVKDHLMQSYSGGLYEKSVQVQWIISKGRLSTMDYPKPRDFLGIHLKYSHPRTLLRPQVTLYCVTLTHAYFVESPKHIDVHSSRTSPFMYMAQFEYATKLYIIPLVHFHRFAKEVGDPQVPVLWISSTGRCGSTLLIQMLENIPGTICMSEPDVTTNICLMSRAKLISRERISRIMQSSIRLLCKEGPSVQRIVIKTRFNCSTELTMVQENFPNFKHLYLYRNLGDVLKSYYKFLHRDAAVCLVEYLFNNRFVKTVFPILQKYQIHFIAGRTSKQKLKKAFNTFSFMGFVAGCVASCIVEFQHLIHERGLVIKTLHYDELMRSPLKVTKKLFELMDLPQQYIATALAAMEHDTQKGTILSNISNSYNKEITTRDYKDMNMVLSLLGLPGTNQSFALPHPIQI